MHLYFAPNTAEMHRQACQIHEVYGLEPLPQPSEALILANQEGVLIASVYLYPCGPFLYAEFGVTNPDAPLRAAHQAAEMLLTAFLASAAARGLRPMANPTSKGVQMMLRRFGFRNTGAPCYVGVPFVQVTSARVPETATPQEVAKATPSPADGDTGEGAAKGHPEKQDTSSVRQPRKRRKVSRKKAKK